MSQCEGGVACVNIKKAWPVCGLCEHKGGVVCVNIKEVWLV